MLAREELELHDKIYEEIKALGGMEAFYKEIIKQVVYRFKNNRTHAASFLGISVRTIRKYADKKKMMANQEEV